MSLTVAEVLARCEGVYAACGSYRDSGEVVTVFVQGEKPYQHRTQRKPFRTLFVRPDLFRFQFRDAGVGPESEWSLFVVWATRGEVRTWSTRDQRVNGWPSIEEGLSGPTGISGGSAIRVPRLLVLAEKRRFSLPAADGATLREAALPDGTACHVVRGSKPMGNVEEVWIDSATNLIRMVKDECRHTPEGTREMRARSEKALRESAAIDPEKRAKLLEAFSQWAPSEREFTTETTTTYAPELGCAIPPEDFEFQPY